MTSLPTVLAVRRAQPADREALVAMVERCSPETIYRRFHGAPGPYVRRTLDRIAAPDEEHRSWVAAGADGEIHGTATLAWGRDGRVEAALLVEDAWHRRGLGRSLMAALAAEARRAGVPRVTATVQADNVRVIEFARAVVPGLRPRYRGGNDLELTVAVPPLALRADARDAGTAREAA